MAILTRSVVRALESNPELYEQALEQAVALMRQEQQVADGLAAALARSGFPETSGWIDWPEVIGYFRERATAEYLRNELRRNERIGRRAPPSVD
jgi:hypothetical protein